MLALADARARAGPAGLLRVPAACVRIGFTAASTFGILGRLLNELDRRAARRRPRSAEMVTREQVRGAAQRGDRPRPGPAAVRRRDRSAPGCCTGRRCCSPCRPATGSPGSTGPRRPPTSPASRWSCTRRPQARYFYDLVVSMVPLGTRTSCTASARSSPCSGWSPAGRGIAFVPASATRLGIPGVSLRAAGHAVPRAGRAAPALAAASRATRRWAGSLDVARTSSSARRCREGIDSMRKHSWTGIVGVPTVTARDADCRPDRTLCRTASRATAGLLSFPVTHFDADLHVRRGPLPRAPRLAGELRRRRPVRRRRHGRGLLAHLRRDRRASSGRRSRRSGTSCRSSPRPPAAPRRRSPRRRPRRRPAPPGLLLFPPYLTEASQAGPGRARQRRVPGHRPRRHRLQPGQRRARRHHRRRARRPQPQPRSGSRTASATSSG